MKITTAVKAAAPMTTDGDGDREESPCEVEEDSRVMRSEACVVSAFYRGFTGPLPFPNALGNLKAPCFGVSDTQVCKPNPMS